MRIRLRYTIQSTQKLLHKQLPRHDLTLTLLRLLTLPVELHPNLPRTPEEIQSLRAQFIKQFGKLPERLLWELTLPSHARGSGIWAGVLQSEAFRLASPEQIGIACSLSSRPMSLLVETYKLLSNYAVELATTSKLLEETVQHSSIPREAIRRAFDRKYE